MTTISTKFSVGDVVYWGYTTSEKAQHACPDCNGTRQWKATSPAGEEYEFPCPRCTAYLSDDTLSLNYQTFKPAVKKMTIGSVQYNSQPYSGDSNAQYMCVETGVGSGSVYSEDKLFFHEPEALAAADIQAKFQNVSIPHIVKRYNKSISISEYQLSNAKLKNAADERSRARSLLWHFDELVDKIKEAEDKDTIIEAVDDYLKYDWEADKANASPEKEAS